MAQRSERANVIAFLGIDGSGKSTQAKLLATWLETAGHKVTYLKTSRGRSKLAKVARLNGFTNLMDFVGAESATLMTATLGWWGLLGIRRTFREPGSYVVLDRYMQCHAAMALVEAPAVEPKVRALFRQFPVPDLIFFVHAPPAVAHGRTLARDGRENDTLEHLAAFDRGYRMLPDFDTFIPVDGNRPPDLVQTEIRRIVAGHFQLPDLLLAET